MLSLPRVFSLLFLLTVSLRAQAPLESASRAQALLGADTWSRVIRIENDGASRRYPRVVFALVFELAGTLWFYTDHDGTQSFSLQRDHVEDDKADFDPLLRDIDPGFRRWAEIAGAIPRVRDAKKPLRNGCFIESVAKLNERVIGGARLQQPRLLSFYSAPEVRRAGHTVLVYEIDDQLEIFDPTFPRRRFEFPRSVGLNALTLARAMKGSTVTKARYLSLDSVLPAPAAIASRREPARSAQSAGT